MNILIAMFFVTCTSIVLSFSCSKDNDQVGGDGAVTAGVATHCIEGKLTDGLTGEWLNLESTRMYLIHNSRVYDDFRKTKDKAVVAEENQGELEGLFSLCGLPNTGSAVTLWVKKEGYQDRSVNVTLSSAVPNKNATTTDPGFWAPQIVRSDISIFKFADLQQKDFSIHIYNQGKPVEGAKVYLTRADNSAVMPGILASTDAAGIANYPASDLAFGATYSLKVLPPAPEGESGEFYPPIISSSVVIGNISAVNNNLGLVATGPFSINIDLSTNQNSANSAPVLVSRTSSNVVDAEAKIALIFDRSVRVSEATKTVASGTTATFSSFGTKASGVACATADHGTPVFNTSNNVTISVEGRTVTIAPNFSTAPTYDSACAGVQITYSIASLKIFSSSSASSNDLYNPAGSFLVYTVAP